jgi:NitT/TauT family transport system permease protein
MPLVTQQIVTKAEAAGRPYPNHWDLLAFTIVLLILGTLAWGASQMHTPYAIGEKIPISLSPTALPYYALRTVQRMLIALVFSLIATFIFGTWAAKSRRAERIIIPLIDIFQSVPILSFLTLSIVAFIALFPNNLLGPESCAIFAIFTSQAWNMIFSFYQSVRTIPLGLREAARVFRLSAWQRFWRVEVPFAMPGLLWNMMLSMSGSWFFVVAAEAITVANQTITLPGIGSYIALAIHQKNTHAIWYAVFTMIIVIMVYDQLLFRPLGMWIDKFKPDGISEERVSRPWVATLFQRARWLQWLWVALGMLASSLADLGRRAPRRTVVFHKQSSVPRRWLPKVITKAMPMVFEVMLVLSVVVGLGWYFFDVVTWGQLWHVTLLGAATGLRVVVLIFLASVLWLPIGVWIGMRPRARAIVAPLVQFLAAFPANLMFPVVMMAIIRYDLNANIWSAPLMVLGTQWYILFNVIAGASEIPKDLVYATKNFSVRGLVWWQQFIFPAIFPFFLTGVITAAGGAWNASVVAEVIEWGAKTIHVVGLGNYIAEQSVAGNYRLLMLGTVAMSVYVLLINRLFWRPLYQWAEERFS